MEVFLLKQNYILRTLEVDLRAPIIRIVKLSVVGSLRGKLDILVTDLMENTGGVHGISYLVQSG